MTLPLFPDRPAPRIADTSLDAFARIRPTLNERELVVFAGLWRYQQLTRYPDATGMELADFLALRETQVRPRLTGLLEKGYVEKGPIRASRHAAEGKCRGYRAVVPLAAVRRGSTGA